MPAASLSFEKGGQPIAKVSGGEYNGDVLSLHQEERGGASGKKGVQELELGKHRLSKLPARKRTEVLSVLQEAYARGIPPEHLSPELVRIPGVMDAYMEMSGSAKKQEQTRIKLPVGSSFVLLPTKDPKKREVYYIAGASGSGKSYIARSLAEQYMKQFPDRNVYLISKLEEDDTLDNMKGRKCIRLKPAKLVENPLKDLEMLRDSCCVFDDYDTFTGKELKTILQLIDDIAIMGRHTNTSMLCLTHFLTNYSKTRLLLTEATHFILYPLSTGAHSLNYLLKTYLGMERDEITILKKGGSRWCCIHKNYPAFCVTENEAFLLADIRGGD
jgi:hypothetical protein